MKREVAKIFTYFISVLINTVVAISLFVILIFLGPTLEGKLLPIIDNVDIELIEQNPNSELPKSNSDIFWIRGTYTRACDFRQFSALVSIDGKFQRAKVELIDDFIDQRLATTATIIPTGDYSSGAIRITPAGNSIIVTATHKCHPFWDTITPLFRFDKNQ